SSSSNGGINSATNGRSGSTGSANINLNLKAKTGTGTGTVAGTGTGTGTGAGTGQTTTHKTLPDLKTQRSNSSAGSGLGIVAKTLATHRRDSSHVEKSQLLEKPLTYGPPQQSRLQGLSKEPKEGYLVYSEGKLQAGALKSLIMHMVPTHDYYPEHDYLFAFLLSARLFVRPHELLAQISSNWEQQQQQQQQPAAGAGVGCDVVDEAVTHLNSASPLTQRKAAAAAAAGGGGTAVAELKLELELEPKPQQRTLTQRSAQHCIRLLSEWIEIFPYDFRDERLMQQVRILARKCVYIDNSLGKQVSRILQLLVARLKALEQYEEFLQTLNAETKSELQLQTNHSNHQSQSLFHQQHQQQQQQQQQHHHLHLHNPFQTFLGSSHASHASASGHATNGMAGSAGSGSGGSSSGGGVGGGSTSASSSASSTPQPDEVFGIMDLCPSCEHLAHQLTAIELERLSHIGPEEFVQAFAKDYQQTGVSAGGAGGGAAAVTGVGVGGGGTLNDMKKTRNLESYVQWFNRLSYLTASEIVKYPKKKQRVRIIEYWIETARECFNIGNFNSLMAIIAGLNLAPIGRLKKTWSKVQSAKFSVLEHQMDPTSNFNSYRSTLKAAMWRSEGATEERERIIIPFFSLFVKDLYFLNEGCSNRLPNNHINFEKCSQLAKQVMEFNEWKKVTCPFDQLPNVIAYLQHNAVLNENTLSMASFECEPPENTEEKDRYKTVKAETKQQLLQQLQEQQQQQQ
ncbi:hypothetical protein KR222_007069, partial [Zaprionus bogoriensis]